jgi:hypothetical protein
MLSRWFTVDLDSALGFVHCTDVGNCDGFILKMVAACTSKTLAMLLTATHCKYSTAESASVL